MDDGQVAIFEVGCVECNNLRQHSENVYGLEADEGKEPRMILSANATIDPGTVMVVALNTPLTYVAVIASRERHDLALEAQFVHGEPLQ